jgi:hypothetical protein
VSTANSGKDDLVFYVLAGIMSAWGLSWIIGLLAITH